MKSKFLILILATLFCSGCKQPKQTTSNSHIQQSNIFEISEGNSIFVVDNNIDDSLVNKKVVLKGKVHDTGKLNMFYTYRVEKDKIIMSRFFLDRRVFEDKFSSKWIVLEGFFSKTGKYNAEITVEKTKDIRGMDKIIEKAISYSKKWVDENRKHFDLNEYKKTERFHKAFSSFKKTNLNSTKFQPDSTLTFIDFNTKTMGVNCGCHVLRETEQHKDYLCFHAIYNYEKNILTKVLVQNTGKFLE